MPKQTYFHLSKDKQETLIAAAKQEFSRVPLHEASIANIIKSAGIPRGSFYQYFEDKEDLFYYLLNQLSVKNHLRFISVLQTKTEIYLRRLLLIFNLCSRSIEIQNTKTSLKMFI